MTLRPVHKKKPPAVAELVYHDVEQGSTDWHAARCGKTTASTFSAILAGSEERKGRATLMRRLVGEIMTGEVRETYTSKEMEEGKLYEPEVRAWYARKKFAEVTQTGFIYNPAVDAGWSPDGLVGDEGAIEIKWHTPAVMVAILDKGTLPLEHRPQCHGGLWVGRRKWIDLILYSHPKMPKYVARIELDLVFQKEISNEIEKFNWERDQLVKKMRSMMVSVR